MAIATWDSSPPFVLSFSGMGVYVFLYEIEEFRMPTCNHTFFETESIDMSVKLN